MQNTVYRPDRFLEIFVDEMSKARFISRKNAIALAIAAHSVLDNSNIRPAKITFDIKPETVTVNIVGVSPGSHGIQHKANVSLNDSATKELHAVLEKTYKFSADDMMWKTWIESRENGQTPA